MLVDRYDVHAPQHPAAADGLEGVLHLQKDLRVVFQLVVEPEECFIDGFLWDLYDRAFFLVYIVGPTGPVDFSVAQLPAECCATMIATDFLCQRVIQHFSSGHRFVSVFDQCLSGIEHLLVDNGRVAIGYKILGNITFVPLFPLRKSIGSVFLLQDSNTKAQSPLTAMDALCRNTPMGPSIFPNTPHPPRRLCRQHYYSLTG